jgi:Tol biopolymer transport system component
LSRYFDLDDPAWGANGRLAIVLGGDAGFGHIGTVTANGRRLRLVTRSMSDSDPDWSPTARRIAFRRESPGSLERDAFRGDVYVAPVSGQHRPRRLSFGRDAFDPVWSPNGRRIAFVRAPDLAETGSLWISRAADGRQLRIVAGHAVAAGISWQPGPRR